jgi:hypothetical protein
LEAAVPQQRKLEIVMASDRKTIESTVVELSDDVEKELKKAINQAKAHGGQIISVDLKP